MQILFKTCFYSHISELMQTEMHHIQTLFIMSEIFRKGMKEELQLDHSTVDRIFPCLDELLEIHRHFFYSMKERRQASCTGSDKNFVINRIGDILVQQVRFKGPASRTRKVCQTIFSIGSLGRTEMYLNMMVTIWVWLVSVY